MTSLRVLLAACVALPLLSACFTSKKSLIAGDEAILPVEQSLVICLEADDPCIAFERRGDGYFGSAPDSVDSGAAIRFAALAQAGGRQVFLVETELEEGEGFIYGLARRLSEPDARGATMQVAGLDCADFDQESRQAFEAGGGRIDTGFITNCQPASLGHLKQTLLQAYRAELADDDWWLARAADL